MTRWLLTYAYAVANNEGMDALKTWLSAGRGRQVALAKHLKIRPPSVASWLVGKRPIPIEHAAAIERFTGGEVTRKDLFPDRWRDIWPELALRRSLASVSTPKTEATHVN